MTNWPGLTEVTVAADFFDDAAILVTERLGLGDLD